MDGFSDHRWRETGPPAGQRVRRAAGDPRGTDEAMGSRLGFGLARAGSAEQDRCRPHGDHPRREALGDAGHQPATGSLRLPHRADRHVSQALSCRAVENAHRSQEQSGIRLRLVHPSAARTLTAILFIPMTVSRPVRWAYLVLLAEILGFWRAVLFSGRFPSPGTCKATISLWPGSSPAQWP